jgi:hypothetical protein
VWKTKQSSAALKLQGQEMLVGGNGSPNISPSTPVQLHGENEVSILRYWAEM